MKSNLGTNCINGHPVGPGEAVYIIAEIGSNHNQSLDKALEMISLAAQAGADAVKFQSIQFDQIYSPMAESKEFRDWFQQIELDESWYQPLANKASDEGVDFLSAPTYEKAIELLEEVGVPAYKIASPQVQANLPLVKKAAMTGKPLILSMGYCEYHEIEAAIKTCREAGNEQVFPLHCVSKYPIHPGEGNLKFIQTLSQMTSRPTGFSDHSIGDHLAISAITLGACIIEKHVTTDRSLPGPDHHFAMTFGEFSEMVRKIREVEMAFGQGQRPTLLEAEYKQREALQLKAFTKEDIKAGDPVEIDKVTFLRSTHDGVLKTDTISLLKHRSVKNLAAGTLLSWEDIEEI